MNPNKETAVQEELIVACCEGADAVPRAVVFWRTQSRIITEIKDAVSEQMQNNVDEI